MSEHGELVMAEEEAVTKTTLTSFDLVNPDDASAFMKNYQDVCDAMLEESDYQVIGEKKTKKKSAWRKLATAFRISDEVIAEELHFDDTNQIVSARYKVKASLPNGRSTIGVGVCSIFDKIRYRDTGNYVKDTDTPSNFALRGRFSNAEHDVPSTAHTRAKNRAIADLIGAGEVSADELDEYYEDSDSDNQSSSPKKNNTSKRRSSGKKRTRRKKKAEDNVIETKAEVVEDKTTSSSSSSDFDELAKENKIIESAIQRITEAKEEVTKAGIIDELFALYDIGTISEEEYFETKGLLE